ncbi:PREDICTED: putative inhibitor of apoptosis [Nanorana parkeri]|uniref:putative inhibitor of apoptosis n=1 Tax=Nanorana parkeri TaxID=125878 RepID=UPI0008544A75|nr:PREDICTED: putative inhibitor of apoptosis [Nanorana parkeri]
MEELNNSQFLSNLLKSDPAIGTITLELSCELYRISTFSKFPNNVPVSERSLAKAGFYYTGVDDKVKCFTCGLMLDNWKRGDIAFEKHKKLCPSCSFIQNANSVNLGASLYSAFSPPSSLNSPLQPEEGVINISYKSIPHDSVTSRSVEDMSHLRSSDNSCMYTEEARLHSFTNWQVTFLNPSELAKAGFYYLGPGDRVACFACDGKLNNWEPNDNALAEHRRHFPDCSFVSAAAKPSLRSNVSNVCMQTTSSRLKTFLNWPSRIPVTPKKLSEAGFYYVGRNDDVKCFCCDGGLRCWESGDDPWVEHAKWFPRCEYLLHIKGQGFVRDIQERYPHLLDQLLSTSESQNEAQYPPIIRLDKESNQDDETYMNTTVVQDVLAMGFNRRLVKETIFNKILTSGGDYKDTVELVTDLLSAQKEQTEEEKDRQSEQNSEDEVSVIRKSYLALAQRMTSCLCMAISDELLSAQVISYEEYDTIKSKKTQTLQAQDLLDKVLTKGKNIVETFKKSLDVQDPGLYKELFIEQSLRSQASDDYSDLPMEEQLRRLQEERTCKICMDQEVSIVFIPCGHLVVCKDCAPSLRKCPICRGIIKGTVRTFLS